MVWTAFTTRDVLLHDIAAPPKCKDIHCQHDTVACCLLAPPPFPPGLIALASPPAVALTLTQSCNALMCVTIPNYDLNAEDVTFLLARI